MKRYYLELHIKEEKHLVQGTIKCNVTADSEENARRAAIAQVNASAFVVQKVTLIKTKEVH